MNIFNSLGSNYDFNFIRKSFFEGSGKEDIRKLEKYLSEKYGGMTLLTYKGREALQLALRIINKPSEYVVGVCGFTCYAVYEAIVKEGYKVEYLDIEKDDLNFSIDTLKAAIITNPKLKIIFIQNTLGYPCDMEKIEKFCREKEIILVEDLAHSIGATYKNGKEAGTVGDFTMLSFSQDKVIDKVSGGALIVRNESFVQRMDSHKLLKEISRVQQIKDTFYPVNTLLIRKTYSIELGKIIHRILKSAKILSNPMEYIDMGRIHLLPANYARSVIRQFKTLEQNISHRKKIARIYRDVLDENILSIKLCSTIDISSNLRFPIFIEKRNSLISNLKENKIFVSDIWYDAPIAPKKYLHMTDYKSGICSNSEDIADKILNLPTHRNVSEKDATFIADKINLWLKLQ